MINLSNTDVTLSVKHLKVLLANTYVLALKTQNYHWNVKGPTFAMLHTFFGEQYEALADAIDEIAEQIRMLRQNAPATMQEFLKLTTLTEDMSMRTEKEMLKGLLHDHEEILVTLRSAIEEMSAGQDEGTIDFMVGRLREHEKSAWMLRSHLTD